MASGRHFVVHSTEEIAHVCATACEDELALVEEHRRRELGEDPGR